MMERRIMSEPMKPKLTEAIYDLIWLFVTCVVLAIQSIPLALAILVALALWLLPEAIGWHQSLAHILSELNRAGVPHGLFFITKQLFVVSWFCAFFTKLLDREKRRNGIRVGLAKAATEKLEKPLADEN